MGFIHTGKMLSFVYDVADLYKTRISIPIAFRETAAGSINLESRVRQACRDEFRRQFFLKTIIKNLQTLLNLEAVAESEDWDKYHQDEALPGELWDPQENEDLAGGRNFAPDQQEEN